MFCTKISCACLILIFTLVCNITAKAKPPPSLSPWSTYKGKPGVPMTPGMDTITVPYMGKSSPFFPKFVDPKTMISQKTDFLSNLFGGVGPVSYPMSPDYGVFPFGPSKSSVYARSIDSEPTQDMLQPKDIFQLDSNDENQVNDKIKRGAFGPVSSPFGPMGPKFGPMGPKFGPMGPKFGPMGPKFGPFASLSPQFTPGYGSPFYGSKLGFNPMGASSRRKRSLASVTSAPPSYGPPSPYGPFSPVPMVDPSVFIAKKTAFLNALFSSLATSTPATIPDLPTPKSTIVPPQFWSPFETTTTEVPVPKSTIVPPGFWLPSSIIPTPGEYTDKVEKFLDKLFESLKVNKTQMTPYSITSSEKVARSVGLTSDDVQGKQSVEDLQTLITVKDAIVDAIITELGSLKTEMVNNMNDLIMSQTMTGASMAKKPIKPIKAAFAGFYAPTTDYSLPFRQKMAVLNQVFDTLIELQKNITIAVTDAIKNSTASTETPSFDNDLTMNYGIPSHYLYNVTLFDILNGKMTDLNSPQMNYQPPFWMAYTKNTMKRDVNDDFKDDIYENSSDDDKDQQYKRAVKMSMHQGYESMSPGTIESVQTGGGSVPGHQGGGMKLMDSQNNDYDGGSDWLNYFKNQYKGYKYHHNHH